MRAGYENAKEGEISITKGRREKRKGNFELEQRAKREVDAGSAG